MVSDGSQRRVDEERPYGRGLSVESGVERGEGGGQGELAQYQEAKVFDLAASMRINQRSPTSPRNAFNRANYMMSTDPARPV
jgi:hypothetical protein